jgi:hypothetical protein
MAKNDDVELRVELRSARTLDLRTLTMAQRAEWLARTLVGLADAHCDVRDAAEEVEASGWQPGAYAVLPGDMFLDDDGEFRPEPEGDGGTDAG